jgi:RNA polymerase sigma factor (sigma-70 family)
MAELIRSGSDEGITSLLQEYGGRVSGYLRRRFPSFDDHDILEVLADAVLVLANTFDPTRGSLAAWLLFLAHQQAVGKLRSRNSAAASQTLEDQFEPLARSRSPLDELVTQERLLKVHQVMASLSDLERAVIEADLAEGTVVQAEQLAGRLKTTEGSVYAARQRARRKLVERCDWIRNGLQGRGFDDGEETQD